MGRKVEKTRAAWAAASNRRLAFITAASQQPGFPGSIPEAQKLLENLLGLKKAAKRSGEKLDPVLREKVAISQKAVKLHARSVKLADLMFKQRGILEANRKKLEELRAKAV